MITIYNYILQLLNKIENIFILMKNRKIWLYYIDIKMTINLITIQLFLYSEFQ